MQKLVLLLLPLAIAACMQRETPPVNSAPRVTYPTAPAPSFAPSPAARPTMPGRGEGERESPASDASRSSGTTDVSTDDDMPDGTVDGAMDTGETSDVERNRAGSSDIDPTNHPAIIDESGAIGFGGRIISPASLGDGRGDGRGAGLGDGELRDDDGTIEPDELHMMPADVVDAGPALIP